MAGKGGGAWKVAYADFATAMMAFFLVMWITTQNKAVKDSVAQYFENPLGTSEKAHATSIHGIPGASAETELEREQAGPHGSSSREQGTYAHDDDQTPAEAPGRPPLHIFDGLDKTRTIGTMVIFPGDSTELTFDAQQQLSELANELRGKPHKIEVRGHASRRPTTESAATWDLSYARAMNTMKFLVSCELEPERFRLSQEGAFEPYSHLGNPVVDPRNGRVEVSATDELTPEFKQTRQQRAGNFVPATGEVLEKLYPPQPPEESEHGGKPSHGQRPAKPAGHGH